jgi:serine/threonine protein kinase
MDGSVFIALEAMDGSLMDLISTNRPVPEHVLACIMKPVMRGLVYLHKTRKLVHRDIKPHNLLFKRDGTIKITDFGVCSELESTVAGANSFVGTVTYMSPERLDGQQYSFSADLWGIGISLIQLATAEHPYEQLAAKQETEMKFWALVTHLKECPSPEPKGNFSPEFKDFVSKCLTKDKDARSSSGQLLEHPWLTKFTSCDDATDQDTIRKWIETIPTADGGCMSQNDLDSALDNLVTNS